MPALRSVLIDPRALERMVEDDIADGVLDRQVQVCWSGKVVHLAGCVEAGPATVTSMPLADLFDHGAQIDGCSSCRPLQMVPGAELVLAADLMYSVLHHMDEATPQTWADLLDHLDGPSPFGAGRRPEIAKLADRVERQRWDLVVRTRPSLPERDAIRVLAVSAMSVPCTPGDGQLLHRWAKDLIRSTGAADMPTAQTRGFTSALDALLDAGYGPPRLLVAHDDHIPYNEPLGRLVRLGLAAGWVGSTGPVHWVSLPEVAARGLRSGTGDSRWLALLDEVALPDAEVARTMAVLWDPSSDGALSDGRLALAAAHSVSGDR